MPTDLLKTAKKKTATKPAAKKDRPEIVLEANSADAKAVIELCELAEISGLVTSPLGAAKDDVKNRLFEIWAQKYWEDKAIPKGDGGSSIDFFTLKEDGRKRDHKCQFQAKEKSGALSSVLPSLEEMPDDKTTEEFIIDHLVKSAKLSKANAKKFVQNEVSVEERVDFSESFSGMYYGDNDLKKSIATKLLKFFTARKGSVDFITDQEMEEVGGSLLETRQTVVLKKGYLDRLINYCRNVEELKLLAVGLYQPAVGQWDFAMGDSLDDKTTRLNSIVGRYIVATDNAK